MRATWRLIPAVLLLCAGTVWLHAQEWTTAGFDAQRTAWLRADAALSKEAVQKGTFKFLWKQKFENEARQLNALTPPVILDRLIGYRGFKALAFIGGSADRVFAIDTDLARPYWTAMLNYSAATGGQPPSSWACPGGLIAAPARRTALAPSAFGRGGGGGRGGRSGSAVGEPGRGAAILSQAPQARGAAPAAPPARGAAPAGRAVAAVPFGGVDPIYAVGGDGFLHTLRTSNGSDANAPVPFLPPSAKPSALIFVEGVVYTTTSGECGAAPNAVWAIDTTVSDGKPITWKTGGPDIAGTSGPAFGTEGLVYVATRSGQGRFANAVVALDRNSLEPKDWFSAPGVDFNASPVVVRYKDKDLVAATADDGRLYLLDGASLGGSDHRTALYTTGKYTAAGAGGGLATWEDQGARWVLAPAVGAPPASVKFVANGLAPNGRTVAFKVVDQGGKPALEAGWASRDLTSPLAPIVVNGLVLAVSSGEYRGTGAALTASQRAARSTPAVLYVLDGATGKELWASAKTITSFARGSLAAGAGQVYLVTYDNHLYAFGVPIEH